MIGGYQICFQKRYFFHAMAQTDMHCYAIKKANWNEIMQEFPDIYRLIRLKIFDFYFNKMYRPLLRQKMMDINCMDRRQDYGSILAVRGDSSQELEFCMHKIFAEEKEFHEIKGQSIIDQSKIYWVLTKLNDKLDNICDIFLKLTHNTEYA